MIGGSYAYEAFVKGIVSLISSSDNLTFYIRKLLIFLVNLVFSHIAENIHQLYGGILGSCMCSILSFANKDTLTYSFLIYVLQLSY